MIDWLTIIGVTVGALLPIVNPLSSTPVFVAITRGMTRAERYSQSRRACIYMAGVLIGSLLIGVLVLEFFGVSLPALRLAGGLVVARLGFGMLNPDPASQLPAAQQEAAISQEDIAFTPLAVPLLSGPGSIALTISIATKVEQLVDYFAVAIGIVIVAFISWAVLRSSGRIVDYMGATGVTVMTRLMGLLLVALGVQFVADGFLELIAVDNPIKALGAFP